MAYEEKRRQHHVWQHYLKAWASSGNVYCLRDRRLFATGTTTLAVENYFYRLPKLTTQDYRLIDFLILQGSERSKALHMNFLTSILGPIDFLENNIENARDPKGAKALLDVARTNVLEDYHAGIEAIFVPYLARIRNGDLSFYQDIYECIPFFMFICTQMMRTKGVKERVIATLRDKNNLDTSRIWDLASIMFAINSGGSLFLERRKRQLAFIQNRTDIEFITGDQPAINLLDSQKPHEQISIYYPVSPTSALILAEVDQPPLYTTETLTAEAVTALNRRMFEASHSQTFAKSAAALAGLVTG